MIRGAFPVAALALMSMAPADAGPPYVTDDPVPTDRRHWEIYEFATGAAADGVHGGEAGVDLNYGAAEDLQLTLVVPAAYERDVRTRVGMGTLEVAAKYRFLHAGEAATSVDVAFFPRIFLPTAADGLGPRRTQLLLPVWVGRDLGPWSVFGGGGYEFNPGDGARNFWTAGVALTRAVNSKVVVGAELFGRTPDSDGARSWVAANLGVTLAVARHWSLLASLGPGLQHARSEGQYGFYVALKADY